MLNCTRRHKRVYYLTLSLLWLFSEILPIFGLQFGIGHFPALVNYLFISGDSLIAGIFLGKYFST